MHSTVAEPKNEHVAQLFYTIFWKKIYKILNNNRLLGLMLFWPFE